MNTGEVNKYILILSGIGVFDMTYCQMGMEFPLIAFLLKSW